jgi:hypothetical protein
MNTIKKIGIIAAGVAAFVVGSVAVTLINSAVSALVPGRSPDTPGQLEPSPEERAKEAWAAKMGKSQEIKSKEEPESTAVTEPASTEEPPIKTVDRSVSEPSHSVDRPTPPRVSTGPGNFDAPAYAPPPPLPSVGPGNL